MKVGVCFKIVPDFEELPAEEWKDVEHLDFTYVKKMYGCFDEAALEMALRMKDGAKAAGVDLETVAVAAGVNSGSVSEGLLRGLFAAGFDDVVILPPGEDFTPRATGTLLSEYFKEHPVDLILTGRMVGPGDSGMVPYYLAKELDFEILPEAVSGTYEDGLSVVCKEGEYLKTYGNLKNCLCTVGDATFPNLRLFPLKARMEAKKRVFTQWEPTDLELEKEDVSFRTEETEESHCNFLEGLATEDIAQEILNILKEEAKI